MKPRISASFNLYDFTCDPQEITSIVGIMPTRSWRKGDKIGKSILLRKENGWSLSSNLDSSCDLDLHIASVFQQMHPVWEKFLELTSQYLAEVSCVIYSYEAQGPAIFLPKVLVQQIAELNAQIDVDFYSLTADKD